MNECKKERKKNEIKTKTLKNRKKAKNNFKNAERKETKSQIL